jgi:transcriptional regulator with XRE-family HTH domain
MDESIGERARTARILRGKSQAEVAGLAGISPTYLSRLETGDRRLDSRALIQQLAQALEVPVTFLTGQPYDADPRQSAGHAAVAAIRQVLLDGDLDDPPDAPRVPLAVLSRRVATVEDRTSASDYAAYGRELPPLLTALQVVAGADGPDREEALRLLIRTWQSAFYLVKDLGYLDLAWITAARAGSAAERLDDPTMLALAAFLQAHATHPAGARDRALAIARNATAGLATDGAAGQVYGMLHLTAALVSASSHRPDDAAAHLDEARTTARHTGEGSAFGLHFGPTNVALWRMAIAVEQHEGGRVEEIATGVDPYAVESPGRRAAFFTDLGRGLAQVRGRDADAVRMLSRAEQLAPQQVRANPLIRELVGHLLRRARATAGGRELRQLAQRVGAVAGA